jgi:hypothetical protein
MDAMDASGAALMVRADRRTAKASPPGKREALNSRAMLVVSIQVQNATTRQKPVFVKIGSNYVPGDYSPVALHGAGSKHRASPCGRLIVIHESTGSLGQTNADDPLRPRVDAAHKKAIVNSAKPRALQYGPWPVCQFDLLTTPSPGSPASNACAVKVFGRAPFGSRPVPPAGDEGP